MIHKLPKLLIYLFFIAFSNCLLAQNDISGTVRDINSGERLPFANVIIAGTDRGTSTNTDGYFVIVDAPIGEIKLVINYVGYNTDTIKINNAPQNNKHHEISLKPITYQIDEAQVVGNSGILDVSTNEISRVTISPRQISILPSIGEVDIYRAIQLLPGITAASDGESGLYIRGGTPDQNLVLFDGMTIYHVDHFFGFFSAFNTDAIKDLQLYKGGFPAEYGGRISSVVKITGKTGDQNRFKLSSGINMLSARAALEIPLWKKGNLLIAGRRSYTDIIQSRTYNRIFETLTGEKPASSDVSQQNNSRPVGGNVQTAEFKPSFYFYDLNAKITYNLSKKDLLTLSFYSGKDNLDKSQDYSNLSLTDASSDLPVSVSTTDLNKWGNIGVSGKWARQWTNRLHSEFLLSSSKYFSNYDKDAQVAVLIADDDSTGTDVGFAQSSKEDNLVGDLTSHIDLTWYALKHFTFKSGLVITNFHSEYNYFLDDTVSILDLSEDGLLASFYTSNTLKFWKNEILFGLRSSYYNKTEKMYWEPRVSINVPFLNHFSAKAAWGYYYQFVKQVVNENILEGSRDFWILSDKDLKPISAEHRILGLNYELNSWLFSIEGYYKKMQNLSKFTRRFTGQADYSDYFFIGDGVAKGLEFLLQRKSGKITGWIGYTLGNVEHTFPSLNNGEPFPSENDRRHEINLVGKYTLGKWSFAATSVYASGKAVTQPESQYVLNMLNGERISYIHVGNMNAYRLPDYFRLDLSVSREFKLEKLIIESGLSIFNVTNHKNVWYREYNLETIPVTVTDALMLGITPTVYLNVRIK